MSRWGRLSPAYRLRRLFVDEGFYKEVDERFPTFLSVTLICCCIIEVTVILDLKRLNHLDPQSVKAKISKLLFRCHQTGWERGENYFPHYSSPGALCEVTVLVCERHTGPSISSGKCSVCSRLAESSCIIYPLNLPLMCVILNRKWGQRKWQSRTESPPLSRYTPPFLPPHPHPCLPHLLPSFLCVALPVWSPSSRTLMGEVNVGARTALQTSSLLSPPSPHSHLVTFSTLCSPLTV